MLRCTGTWVSTPVWETKIHTHMCLTVSGQSSFCFDCYFLSAVKFRSMVYPGLHHGLVRVPVTHRSREPFGLAASLPAQPPASSWPGKQTSLGSYYQRLEVSFLAANHDALASHASSFLSSLLETKNDDSHKVVLIPSIIDSGGFFSQILQICLWTSPIVFMSQRESFNCVNALSWRGRHGLSGTTGPWHNLVSETWCFTTGQFVINMARFPNRTFNYFFDHVEVRWQNSRLDSVPL